MATPEPPQNRKARRAAAKANGTPFTPLTSAADIPMSQPDRSGPKTKTLFEIADERNDLLAKGQPFSPVHGDGLARDENGRVLLPAKEVSRPAAGGKGSVGSSSGGGEGGRDADDGGGSPIGVVGESVFLCTTLSMLHFTLSLLVANQYASKPPTLWPLAGSTASAAPVLLVFIYLMKLPWLARKALLRQVLHFGLGTGAGCYLIWIGNRENYLGVMKRAPPVGTVWVWNVIEMKLEWAVASLGVCGVWLWWNGFSIM